MYLFKNEKQIAQQMNEKKTGNKKLSFLKTKNSEKKKKKDKHKNEFTLKILLLGISGGGKQY